MADRLIDVGKPPSSDRSRSVPAAPPARTKQRCGKPRDEGGVGTACRMRLFLKF
jgi:hypothetical protein